MGTDKRERQRAAREAKEAAEVAQVKKSRRVRSGITVAVIVALALVAAFAFSFFFSGSGSDDDGDVSATTTTTAADDDEATSEDGENEDEEATSDDAVDCPEEDGSSPRQVMFSAPPPICIDLDATYVAEVETTVGTFEITLDATQAPVAVNNFVVLSRWGYYSGVEFHRVIPDFMVQAGEAPADDDLNEEAPGYGLGQDPAFDGELPTDDPPYPVMSVAMANVAGDPGTAGAQFFVMTGPQPDGMGDDYSRFGQVTAGEDVVRSIEQSGEDGDAANRPADPPVIESITIAERG